MHERDSMDASNQDFWRLVAMARNPFRLFAIRSNKYHSFYAGHLPDGLQALIGRTRDKSILLISFSTWGALYNIQRITLPQFQHPPEELHQFVNDTEFHKKLEMEFGFKPGLVRVQQFLVSDDECGFSVGPFPGYIDQFLEAPEQDTPDEQAECYEQVRQFIARGVCVLNWGNDWHVLEANGVEAGWELP